MRVALLGLQDNRRETYQFVFGKYLPSLRSQIPGSVAHKFGSSG